MSCILAPVLSCCSKSVSISEGSFNEQGGIVYSSPNNGVVAIHHHKNETSVLDFNANYFIVSKDGGTIVSFHQNCADNKACKIKIFDLDSAVYWEKTLPFGNWEQSWWANDDKRLYVVRQIRERDGKPACGEDEEQFGCAMRAILQISTYHIRNDRFIVEREFERGDYSSLADYEESVKPAEGHVVMSPDKASNLVEAADSITLVQNQQSRLVFRQPGGDFSDSVWFTKHPWSPDSRSFVVTYWSGGLFRVIFSLAKSYVYKIDISTMEWTKLVHGRAAYWLPNLPTVFRLRQQSENVL